MAAQKGKDLLLKVANPTGVFVSVVGLRTRQIVFNAEPVDVTNAESAGRWRELLAGTSVRRASISGTGVFRDDDSDAQVRDTFFNGDIRVWRVIVPDFGTIEGLFQVTTLEYRGDHVAEVTFEMTLESAGALTFTAL
jgi:TP901-1 family phage major tail protein